MKVIVDWPPNIEKIQSRFNLIGKPNVVFAYGDTIYSPAGSDIPAHLMAHEETHQRQQEKFGGVEAWWDKYLEDDMFRLDQEVEAYRNQLAAAKDEGRAFYRRLLRLVTKDLSGRIYGNLVDEQAAAELLK